MPHTPRPRVRKRRVPRIAAPARYLLYAAGLLAFVGSASLTFYYLSFSAMIDARLNGERERTLPRVYARPVELRLGQSLTQQDLVSRLNDLGYAQRSTADGPGEFAVVRNAVAITPRGGAHRGRVVRVGFPGVPPVTRAGGPGAAVPRGIRDLEIVGRGKTDAVQLESPLLTALVTSGGREKRRSVPLSAIPTHMQQA